MSHFVGVLDGSDDVWGVWVPDYPGAHGGGGSPEEAIESVISAMRDLDAIFREEGLPIPVPRSIAEVKREPDVADAISNGDILVLLPDVALDRPRAAAE